MDDLDLPCSPSAEDRALAVEAITAGKSVSIGGCSIHPDEIAIWGTDCYGVDAFMTYDISVASAEKAIEWAIAENKRDDHPAERNYQW